MKLRLPFLLVATSGHHARSLFLSTENRICKPVWSFKYNNINAVHHYKYAKMF